MATDLVNRSVMLERLSALVDGELEEASFASACATWREDEEVRESWHSYQLIGDVLRSEDLGSDATHDAAFMKAIRTRLASEPVVLALQPVPVPPLAASGQVAYSPGNVRNRRWSWATSAAVAAGFVAVAGVVLLVRAPDPGQQIAARAGAKLGVQSVSEMQATAPVTSDPSALAPDPQVLVANGKFIRDLRLDRYLAAHKQFAGSSALGVPSAFLRSATADASDR